MTLILSGTDGLSDIDGSAATPAIRGTDANTGIFFPAADTIAFSEGGAEIARFDSSGNLGIGTSSPSARLTVSDTNAIPLRLGDVSSAPTSQTACYVGTATTGLSGAGNGDLVVIPRTSTTGSILFWTGNGTAAERVRIDSSGNVGIGTTTPQSTFQVGSVNAGTSESTNKGLVMIQGGPATVDSAGGLEFKTSSSGSGYGWKIGGLNTTNDPFVIGNRSNSAAFTERMRIDSSGNLLVGDTGVTGYRLVVKGASATSSDYATLMRNSSNTELFSVRNDGRFVTGTGSASPYNSTTGGAANFVVNSDGACQRSTSSLKYKTEVQDATHGLAEVMSLRPVTYKGKNDGDKVFGGLIAEEVHETGLTEFVQYADDGSPDALAYGNMVSLCIKAIQEQQALIQSLTARITALETQSADNPPQGETP